MTAANIPASDASEGRQTAAPGAWPALFLLLAINLFNYLDRQVLAAVEPEIRAEYLEGRLSRADAMAWSGLLSTAFLVSYMVLAPLFGWLAQHVSRWLLIGVGVILWSLASGASGVNWGVSFVAAYWILLLTRCLVGVGEAAYMPIAPAMIADLFPIQRRGQVMAWFFLAIPIGGALGYTFGEVIQSLLNWRWAFFLVVPPGILLGVICFFMPDPPRGQTDNVDIVKKKMKVGKLSDVARSIWRILVQLMSIPSYRFNTLGMTAMTFAIGALAFWMPDYLDYREAETLVVLGSVELGPRTFFGIITAVAGVLGTLMGGLTGDWLRPRYSGSYFIVSGAAFIIGFPMLLLVLVTPFPFAWIFIFLGVFALFFNTGPTNTILANVTHPSIRESGFAFNILLIHAFGDAISPPIIGYISGLTSRDVGFAVVALTMLLGGVLWLLGARHLGEDTRLAPTRAPENAV